MHRGLRAAVHGRRALRRRCRARRPRPAAASAAFTALRPPVGGALPVRPPFLPVPPIALLITRIELPVAAIAVPLAVSVTPITSPVMPPVTPIAPPIMFPVTPIAPPVIVEAPPIMVPVTAIAPPVFTLPVTHAQLPVTPIGVPAVAPIGLRALVGGARLAAVVAACLIGVPVPLPVRLWGRACGWARSLLVTGGRHRPAAHTRSGFKV